jgi:uncharacterized RDD family membrane protein YckC
MESITIQTSQNIDIEQSLASVGERIVAAGIDYLFLFTYFIIVAQIGSAVEKNGLIIILMIPACFYQLISELAMNGQSWGKKIMKIKVVKIDGTQLSFLSCLIRWIFRLVDIVVLFGAISVITIILNGKGQRLGDIAVNTTVIRLRDKSLSATIYANLPEGYSLVYSQVNKLSDTDIYTAREVLDFLNKSYFSANSLEMATKAKRAIEAKMGVQSDLGIEKFLQTVICDYNYIHSRSS